jgi:hypothetical protein
VTPWRESLPVTGRREERNGVPTPVFDTADPAAAGAVASVRGRRADVLIVFNVDEFKANLLGHGPVPVTPSLFDQTPAEPDYLFENMSGEVLRFGRSRRAPSVMQRLAVMARDGHCLWPGCFVPPDRCDVHHFQEWMQDQGVTDVELIGLSCGAHHQHVHVENLYVVREVDGEITIQDRSTHAVIVRGVSRKKMAVAA